MRIALLRLVASLALVLSHALADRALGNAGAAVLDSRPNILLFITDDQAHDELGAAGNKLLRTPNIDSLAAEGTIFADAFTTTSICAVSRASILTGQTMRRHGIDDFHKPLSEEAFSRTYPMLLRKSGYRTGFLGKFAIGSPDKESLRLALPADRFDTWYAFPQTVGYRQVENGRESYLTSVITEKAIDFIKQGPANLPFCLTVAFLEPHGPYDYFDPAIPDRFGGVSIPVPSTLTRGAFDIQPKYIRESLAGSEGQAWLGNSETYRNRVRIVYRLIERADAAVGQIMESLRRQGLDGNTVVIFASDNGNLRGAHGLTGKWLMYEESIRVPLIVRDPRLPASRRGLVSEEMALNIDLAPTVLAFAGVPIPQEMQGRDLGPLIRGEPQAWRQDWYYEHTLQTPPSYSIPKSEGVRTKEWKYIRYTDFSPPVEQLFNLSSDPREMSDLSGYAEHFGVLVRLRSRCDELREQLR